ncbi:hypothetical protein SPAR40_2012 [Streptococcus pneumoniae GA16531]|nr:hypothetical protein SPAR40_2012 [Streptococcus pneumoniae GA16531]
MPFYLYQQTLIHIQKQTRPLSANRKFQPSLTKSAQITV